MPTHAASHIYSFFGLTVISCILISSFSAFAINLQAGPEQLHLTNLLKHVASKGCELVAFTTITNSTSAEILDLPTSIGSKPYWIRLNNLSSSAWIEGSLGVIHGNPGPARIYLPNGIAVTGNYSGGFGSAILRCHRQGSTIYLTLTKREALS
ncbi:MAG: hypothetical protein JSV35_04485 [Candidatus Bathyarchaeota archaeon]|nr:MAG: hypothetical protein JSV35_04485 [Candidatus Bathyarchaeota archaeon]